MRTASVTGEAAIARLLNENKGELPEFAWPGGYQMFYLDSENSVLCAECATKSATDPDEILKFKPITYDIYYEGAPMNCEQCNAEILSAYGDPSKENNG